VLLIPRGSFANPSESLKLDVTFKAMDFKTFVILAYFVMRMSSLDSSVKASIEAMDGTSLTDNLIKAKVSK
jgi:hypothetical protein